MSPIDTSRLLIAIPVNSEATIHSIWTLFQHFVIIKYKNIKRITSLLVLKNKIIILYQPLLYFVKLELRSYPTRIRELMKDDTLSVEIGKFKDFNFFI